MNIDFMKLSPGGNDTIIVLSKVPDTERASVARTLMSKFYIGAEQVGYLTLAPSPGIDGRLDMMGGEFSVNGLRSAATAVAEISQKMNVRLGSSGTDELFDCKSVRSDDRFFTSITLSIAAKITPLTNTIQLVRLDGISHLLCEFSPQGKIEEPLKIFEAMLNQFKSELDHLGAFGIISFQQCDDGFRIFPVIYVRETDTVVFETGCGSASIALALSTYERTGANKLRIYQPSGCAYQIDCTKAGEKIAITLGSEIDMLVNGVAFL